VQRVGDPLRQQAVGGDRVRHVGRLDRDLEVLEVEALHQFGELDRGRDQGLDRRFALEFVQVLGQRAGVDPDPHRYIGGVGLDRDLGDFVAAADVPWVEADAVGAGVDRFQRQGVVEVDVGDDRDRRLHDDRLQRLDVLLARDRAADDVGAGLGDLVDLLHRRRQVGGLGLGHRLHRDRRAAADRHLADEYLPFGSHVRSVPGRPGEPSEPSAACSRSRKQMGSSSREAR